MERQEVAEEILKMAKSLVGEEKTASSMILGVKNELRDLEVQAKKASNGLNIAIQFMKSGRAEGDMKKLLGFLEQAKSDIDAL